MKNALWTIALVFFLVLGLVSSVIIVDPVGAAGLVGRAPEKPVDTILVAPPKPKPAVAADSAAEPAKPADGTPASATAADASKTVAQAAPPPRRTPPRRGEAATAEDAKDGDLPEPARKGRYVGPVESLPAGRAPRPELYPMSVLRRTFPDSQSITAELVVQNQSGSHWKTAYIALRSSRMSHAEVFEVQDWALGEVVGIDYTVPRALLNERMSELRVVSISGERRESALADLLARSRSTYLGNLFGEDESTTGRGDTLTAPGMLAVLASLQTPYTGVNIEFVRPRIVRRAPLKLAIPDELRVPESLSMDSSGDSEELRAARQMARELHDHARAFEAAGATFIAELAKAPYADASQTAEAQAALAALRTSLQSFNATGVLLSQSVQRTRDPEVKRLNLLSTVIDYSRRVRGQVEYFENSIRPLDADFKM